MLRSNGTLLRRRARRTARRVSRPALRASRRVSRRPHHAALDATPGFRGPTPNTVHDRMPVPPTAVVSAEKQNKYQAQQERKRHKASNLVCREAAHGPRLVGLPGEANRRAAKQRDEIESFHCPVLLRCS